ncbi:hypothetical protein AAHA92_29205 [Salvia divinorum]|uniref:Uncharacterized protein n=1 Tax=Salvia divinorum TaxID=28513 RepID=A0ABD1G0I4_SALDI
MRDGHDTSRRDKCLPWNELEPNVSPQGDGWKTNVSPQGDGWKTNVSPHGDRRETFPHVSQGTTGDALGERPRYWLVRDQDQRPIVKIQVNGARCLTHRDGPRCHDARCTGTSHCTMMLYSRGRATMPRRLTRTRTGHAATTLNARFLARGRQRSHTRVVGIAEALTPRFIFLILPGLLR